MTPLWPAVLVVWLTVVAGSATSCERATTCNVTSLKLTGRSLLQQSEVSAGLLQENDLEHSVAYEVTEASSLTTRRRPRPRPRNKDKRTKRARRRQGRGRARPWPVPQPRPFTTTATTTTTDHDHSHGAATAMVRFDLGGKVANDVDLFNVFDDGLTDSVGNYEQIIRPHWQRTLACAGTDKEDCRECDDHDGRTGTDCWHDCNMGQWIRKVGSLLHQPGPMGQPPPGPIGQPPPLGVEQHYIGDVKTPRCIESSGSKRLVRFLSEIHVQCPPGRALKMMLNLKKVAHGTLRVYWDSHELGSKALTIDGKVVDTRGGLTLPVHGGFEAPDDTEDILRDSDGDKSQLVNDKSLLAVALPFDNPGGHVFSLEFTPDPDRIGFAQVENLRFFTTSTFTECMDTKLCLNTLEEAPRSFHLRNSNAAQEACLSGKPSDADAKACNAWSTCLAKTGKTETLLALLKAAKVTAKVDSAGTSDKNCLDPTTEDPEAWDCDCYDPMRRRCEELAKEAGITYSLSFESICMRAEYCAHPKVCAGWKTAACSVANIVDDFGSDEFGFADLDAMLSKHLKLIDEAIDRRASALSGRASSTSNRSDTLDSSTGTKNCL